MSYFSLLKPLLHAFEVEKAHRIAINALAAGLVPRQPDIEEKPCLLGALRLKNRVGLAAGFDKNAQAISALFAQGFGMVEVGTVTPRPQEGNPKPRLFRLSRDEAVINRMGFNNDGIREVRLRIERYRKQYGRTQGVLGINIGKNKDTPNEQAAQDYLSGLYAFYPLADYITINISSPNTAGLRALQEHEALTALLSSLASARTQLANETGKEVPLWLKVAPDLEPDAVKRIADITVQEGMDGLIISNTTVARPDSMRSPHVEEPGGLSGKPLMESSTQILSAFAGHLKGALPLIGVGGIASAADARTKLEAGASAVQLYSALVYQGFDLVTRIRRELACD